MFNTLSRALNTFWPSSIRLANVPDDGRNTRALFDKANCLRNHSPLATCDLMQLAIDMMREAVALSETNPPIAIQVAICIAIEELMTADALVESEIDWQRLDVDGYEGLRLRQYLRDQVRFFEQYNANMDTWRSKVEYIFAGLLGYLPIEAYEGDHPGFQVSIIDLLEKPDEAIERLIATVFDDDVTYAGLFREIRETFDHNALIASGIDPKDTHTTNKNITLPTNYRYDTPADLVNTYVCGTAFSSFFTSAIPFAIPEQSRFEHCHILGGTGHGKTQLLQHLIFSDLKKAQQEKRSVVVIDSQGDLIRKISHLALFDPEDEASLADKLVLIDPSDVAYPVSLNMFDVQRDRAEEYSPAEKEKLLNGTIELYENFFGSLLGAELTQRQGVIFKYLARLMLEIPGANILTLRDLMGDAEPYRKYIQKLKGSARYFFEREFFDKGFSATKKQIAKRLWGVLSTSAFERMFAQEHNKVDLFELLNAGSIVLIDTSKDLLKQEGCELFGRFFIAMITQAAMERSVIAEDERTPTIVYADEAHEYFDENIETILNQARKYKIGLVCAHQHLNQLSPGLRAGMLANTSIKIAGGINAKDAGILAAEMQSSSDFLMSMKKRSDTTEFALWVKHATPGSLRITVPLGFLEQQPTLLPEQYEKLVQQNRERFCVPYEEPEYDWDNQSKKTAEEQTTSQQQRSDEPIEESRQSEPAAETTKTVQNEPVSHTEPAPMGRGGRQHTYLQHFIKGLAEDYGWRASIEKSTPEGGFVDVALIRGSEQIACEISVTTSSEHEVQNVRKCLDAGYSTVWVVLHQKKQMRAIKRRLDEAVSKADMARVSILRTDDLPACFAELDVRAHDREETVRGYKVRVKKGKSTLNEGAERRAAVARVVARSLQSKIDT